MKMMRLEASLCCPSAARFMAMTPRLSEFVLRIVGLLVLARDEIVIVLLGVPDAQSTSR